MTRTRRAGLRLTLTMVGIFVIVAIFTGRLFQLQVVEAPALNKTAAEHQTRTVSTAGIRGSIVDDTGVVLALSVDRYDIDVSPAQMIDGYYAKPNDKSSFVSLDTSLQRIAKVTGQDWTDLKTIIEVNPKSQFADLDRKATLSVLRKIQALKIPGIYPRRDPSRSYPNGAVAGNLIGFVGTDGPQAGLELAYDKCLAAKPGTSTYQAGADGTPIPGSTVKQTDPVNGGTLELTIDRDLQDQVLQAITAQAKKIGAPWATAVVERVKDGHLMALADYPSVDPNDPGATPGKYQGAQSITYPYEPGSTFKSMSAAAMIDAGKITPTTEIVVPPVLYLPDHGSIKDSFYHGTLHYTTAGVLENSSNIGISILSEKMSATARRAYMAKFGIGQETAIGPFPGEKSGGTGYLPPTPWDSVTTKTVEFGQGVTATSLQVAQIYETIANHGLREPSTLVSGCKLANGKTIDTQTTKPQQIVTAKTADEVRGMLETVVTGGPIGPLLKIPGYRIAAKTGTAQVAVPGKGYGNQVITSVAGMAPAEDPQYVVVVTFGPTTLTTSAVAAPAFTAVLTDVLKKYRVPPSTTPAPYVQTTW